MDLKQSGIAPLIVIVAAAIVFVTVGVWVYIVGVNQNAEPEPEIGVKTGEEAREEDPSIQDFRAHLQEILAGGGKVDSGHYRNLEENIARAEEMGYPEQANEFREMLSKITIGDFGAGQQQDPESAEHARRESAQEESAPEAGETSPATPIKTASYPQSPAGWSPPSTCSGTAVTFTASPMPISAINHIAPLGQLSNVHVTPTDHGYIYNNNAQNGTISDLRSPADGFITGIGAFPRANDYRIIIWHSCTISTIYIHAYEIAPDILAKTGPLPPGSGWEADQGPDNNRTMPIPVKAGQVIGKMRNSVDFSVHDTSKILSGFVNLILYYGEQWKIHTVDLFEYFEAGLQAQLKDKSIRTIAPVGGKIDYDINGRLVGNWFREGSNGYEGSGSDCTYYECHLAIVYDNVTPNLIRIAIPNSGIDASVCNVCSDVYGVKGNSPDPAGVSVQTGQLKYELVGYEHSDGRYGVRYATENNNNVLGVFLVEMLSDRRIKVEVFPNKNAAEVSGFTDAAKLYER